MKRILFIYSLSFIFISSVKAINSSDTLTNSSKPDTALARIIPAFSMNFNFNLDDFFVGFGAGFEDREYQWGARINFDFRPYFSKVQISDVPNVIDQYYERKYLLTLDVEKRFFEVKFFKKSIRPFLAARGGLLFGNYRGLRQAPESYIAVSPVAGLSFGNKYSFWKIGYTWLDSHNIQVAQNRIFLQVTLSLEDL